MNFPHLPGSRLRAPDDLEELDPAEIDRRFAAMAEEELVPVRPEWLDATVAAAAAARATVRRAGPFRRLMAAAVAMLGVQGTLAAATVATVGAGVVVAAVLWTAERNSNETMSYAMALEILRRGDQPEEHGIAALGKVVGRVRSVVTVLREVRDDPMAPPGLVELCRDGLERLQNRERGADSSAGDEDPLPALAVIRSADVPVAQRAAALVACTSSAMRGLQAIERASWCGDQFEQGRRSTLRRLDQLIAH